jgi:hypothetical protein
MPRGSRGTLPDIPTEGIVGAVIWAILPKRQIK